MSEKFKKLKLIFLVIFSQFAIISAVVYYLKYTKIIEDIIETTNKIIMYVPAVMLISLLIGFFIYNSLAKKSMKLEDENEQFNLYKKAVFLKLAIIEFVGLLTAIMLVLIYNKSYIYMLGIILVFFLLSIPSEQKFRKEFIERKNRLFDE